MDFFKSELFIGFVLGILPSVVMLSFNFLNHKWKIFKYRNLIYKTYVQPIGKRLCSLSVTETGSIGQILNDIGECVKKISYLTNNEIAYLDKTYQFEFIRINEFSNRTFKRIEIELKKIKFEDTIADSSVSNKEILSAANLYVRYYKRNVIKYQKLKIDE